LACYSNDPSTEGSRGVITGSNRRELLWWVSEMQHHITLHLPCSWFSSMRKLPSAG
jgi:hypothetical protein